MIVFEYSYCDKDHENVEIEQIFYLDDFFKFHNTKKVVSKSKKHKTPPLRDRHKWLHGEHRKAVIKGAIRRFLKADKAIPEEWIKEYNTYCL